MENINEFNENNGSIKISDEVIATITSVAASEVDGVSGLMGSIAGEIALKFGKKNINKGIKVTSDDKEAVIDINLIVKYGVKIPEIAWEVQESVKKAVESMCGLTITKVNIHVVGVEFEADNKADNKDTNEE